MSFHSQWRQVLRQRCGADNRRLARFISEAPIVLVVLVRVPESLRPLLPVARRHSSRIDVDPASISAAAPSLPAAPADGGRRLDELALPPATFQLATVSRRSQSPPSPPPEYSPSSTLAASTQFQRRQRQRPPSTGLRFQTLPSVLGLVVEKLLVLRAAGEPKRG